MDLINKLKELEADYHGLPVVAQKADLVEINRIRGELGIALVNAKLRPIGETNGVEEKPKVVAKPKVDHSKARKLYQDYLEKNKELEVHRAYADRVARATHGSGMTPVKPLATMGTNGGPLLCDHCGKAIVLEGGNFQGKTADVGWKKNPDPNWKSYISGGMVVEITVNGTLRIYHGYPGANNNHCCNVARREMEKAEAAYKSPMEPGTGKMILAFLADEFPDMQDRARMDLLNEILGVLFDFDPGIGVNRPEGT